MAQGDGKAAPSAGGGGQDTSLGLSQPNFGAKYDQHISQLQTSLEEAQQRVEQLQKASDELRWGGRGRGWTLSPRSHRINPVPEIS